jgi:sugar phosphate isomerase/epimerase
LVNFAEEKNVKLAIENNVVASFALINGKNKLCLGATAADLESIFKAVNNDNLYLSLDLGHAKVNSHTLRASIDEIIQHLNAKIINVHLSDNNGIVDEHHILSSDSEATNYCKRIKSPYFVLEAYNLNPEVIKAQIKLIEKYVG